MRAQYFDVINIKLDKCGGLTEALKMARASRMFGKQVMVGNMGGSTLAMAPGFVLAQLCDVVDLDGPYGLAEDPLARRFTATGRSSFRRRYGVPTASLPNAPHSGREI